MQLKSITINGFKSFSKKVKLDFNNSITAIVGPNGSGKSNITESFRFVLGEQSLKSLRGKKGEDFIWNGGSIGEKQSNRASVEVNFDNKEDFFGVGFDDFILERVVYRDGTNDYSINNTQVRLMDVNETLARANMGSTGHHIISQGEADRILNATLIERREMIEDGIGLKIYQFKKIESEKKLKKTKDNIKEVQSVQRELAPHIRYLKKQVERFERAKSIAEDLKVQYFEYLKRERIILDDLVQSQNKNLEDLEEKLNINTEMIEKIESKDKNPQNLKISNDINIVQEELSKIESEQRKMELLISRLEGEIIAHNRINKEQREYIDIEPMDLKDIVNIIEMDKSNIKEYTNLTINKILDNILSRINKLLVKSNESNEIVDSLKLEIKEKSNILVSIKEKVQKIKMETESLVKEKEKQILKNQENEKKLYKLFTTQKDYQYEKNNIKNSQQRLSDRENNFERELAEGIVLVGEEIKNYKAVEIRGGLSNQEIISENKIEQKNRSSTLERTKIRLEEVGVERNSEVVEEYTKLSERNNFFDSQLIDLQKTISTLESTIENLTKEINKQFIEGINAINIEFTKFFETLFDGGKCSIKSVNIKKLGEDKQNVIEQKGLDINISLPGKKIKELHQLSGGERSLISIALLFALSRVKPQPFLILDETDAALDEANSRRYGDMVEQLSQYSRLILITHNRETMSRAGKIYGITMIGGASKILSIEFDEVLKISNKIK